MEGWLKLHRKILDSQVFSDPDLLRLWVMLLCRANFKPSFFKGREIRVGEVAFSQRLFCDTLGVSKGKLHRDLSKLKAMGMLTVKAGRDFSVATLCNWETYQKSEGEMRGTNGEPVGRDGGADGSLPKKLTIKEPSPLPPSAEAATTLGIWAEVAEELREAGLSRVDDAVATAQARGLTAESVRALVAEWRLNAGAWGPGALFGRITGQFATWPPVAESFAREQSRKASAKGHTAAVEERLAGERRREREQRRFKMLDEKYAAEIKALSAEKVAEALGSPQLVTVYQARGLTPLVRERLFEVLEAEAISTPEVCKWQ